MGLAGVTAADSCLGVNAAWQAAQPSFGTPENSPKMNGATESVGLSEAASIPTNTKGAVRDPDTVPAKRAGGFNSVYFFTPGIMSDSEAEDSKVAGVRTNLSVLVSSVALCRQFHRLWLVLGVPTFGQGCTDNYSCHGSKTSCHWNDVDVLV